MSRAKLLADLQAASADYAKAQGQLVAERFNVQHGIAHNLMFAESREHVAYHRWLGAHEAFASSAPKPAPKPTSKSSAIEPRDVGAEAVADYWRR